MNLIQKLNLDHRATPLLLALLTGAGAASLAGCDAGDPAAPPAATDDHDHDQDHPGGPDHDHDGDDHDGDDHDHEEGMAGDDHHGEENVALGSFSIGDISAEAWQGHGEAAPGKELHLVLALSPDDAGASVVRVWIGTEDRLASIVSRAAYDAEHGDYDAHAMAPIPLPEDARWWIEVERPDGTIVTGSIPVV